MEATPAETPPLATETRIRHGRGEAFQEVGPGDTQDRRWMSGKAWTKGDGDEHLEPRQSEAKEPGKPDGGERIRKRIPKGKNP